MGRASRRKQERRRVTPPPRRSDVIVTVFDEVSDLRELFARTRELGNKPSDTRTSRERNGYLRL